MPIKKSYRKAGRKTLRRPMKNRSSYARLSKTVALMKRTLKPEKKTFVMNNNAGSTLGIGQLFGNVAGGGYNAQNVTPNPPQGVGGASSRIGNEIKLTSAYYQFQFTQQSATTSPIKVKLYWFHIVGHPQSVDPYGYTTVLFNPNPFSNGTLYDAHSSIDSNYLPNVRLLMKKTVIVGADNYSGLQQTKSVNFGLKLKKPITCRFAGDGGQTLTEGYIYLIMMCDNGNYSSSVTSTFSNCINVAPNTGLNWNYNHISYYTDV